MSDFVIEKLGKVNKDYTLLSPPIGKGFFAKKHKIFQAIYLFFRSFWRSNEGSAEKNRTHEGDQDHQ